MTPARSAARPSKGGDLMDIIIDRLEGDIAVVELPGGDTHPVPRALFPNACEGDVFTISKEDGKKASRQKRVQSKFDRLKRE